MDDFTKIIDGLSADMKKLEKGMKTQTSDPNDKVTQNLQKTKEDLEKA